MISVIMPAYNAERHIVEAITSVLAQEHHDLELIVVDNNSRDGTVQLIEGFTDPRIQLMHQPVQGVSAARNMALARMRGDFFCFLDADDVLPPKSLSARHTLLLADPQLHFADGTVELTDVSMKHVLRTWKPTFTGVPYRPLLDLSPACFVGLTWMIRRMHGHAYAFDTRLTHAEDLCFLLSMARNGRYAYTTEVVLRYRRGHDSAMQNLDGLHDGYRGVLRALQEAPDPPDEGALAAMWNKVRNIMMRSYLKRGQPLRALKAMLERRPRKP